MKKTEKIKTNMPVFSLDSGKYISVKSFTDDLRSILSKFIGNDALLVSGHSFRAALPAALSNKHELATDDDICKWGRWNSDSYKKYTRLKKNVRRDIFNKIVTALSN